MKHECSSNWPIHRCWWSDSHWQQEELQLIEIHWQACRYKSNSFQHRHSKISLGYRGGVTNPLTTLVVSGHCKALQRHDFKEEKVLVKSWDAHSLPTDSHHPSRSTKPLFLQSSFPKIISRLTQSLYLLHPVGGRSAWSQPCIPRNWRVNFSHSAWTANHIQWGPGHLSPRISRQNSLHDWVHKPACQWPMQELQSKMLAFPLSKDLNYF